LGLLDGVEANLLVARGSIDAHAYVSAKCVRMIEVDAPPLGLAEQWELRQHLKTNSLFWATSLAHPFWPGAPLVATVHDMAQLALGAEGGFGPAVRLASRAYMGSLCRDARAVFVNSCFTRDELHRRVGVDSVAPVTVTPLGVDPAWFNARSEMPRAGETPYFVCVGNVRPHKNLNTLLQAFERVANDLPHRLLIVGLQKPGARVPDAAVAGIGDRISSRVQFTGFVPDAELRTLVAGADALVFPSLYEGFGLPALEAMAAGCPVIASRAGALPEVCGDAAAYFSPRAVAELSDRLLEHARLSHEQRARIVGDGTAHARAYTWDRTAELTSQALQKVMAALPSGRETRR
jgi:glycosyltransferase involved in cell wall biosynthesis